MSLLAILPLELPLLIVRTEWPRVLISNPVVLFDKLGSAREGFSP